MTKLLVSSSKDVLPQHLNAAIVSICQQCLRERSVFTIALSGGSLPSFLSTLPEVFASANVDPQFDKWHILLADERCVPTTDPDSNLGELDKNLFGKVPQIPRNQIYGINESKLDEAEAVASDYERQVRSVLSQSGGQLDLAVLGFGPDGHTCSLFPGHALLKESSKWVASIEDSPKPPPRRITLTFPVLNTKTRHVIFCGAGASKSPILLKAFAKVTKLEIGSDGLNTYQVEMTSPPPFPCAMVQPNSELTENTLLWVVDADAMEGISICD